MCPDIRWGIEMYEPGKEVVAYRSAEEYAKMVQKYL